MHSLKRKPHNNLFPPANFGARLLEGLAAGSSAAGFGDGESNSPADPSQFSGRRRALTEIDELLVSDLLVSNQKYQKDTGLDIAQNLNIDSSRKLAETTLQNKKRELKSQLKQNFEQIPKRKLSLDFEHRDKLKSQNLKNLLQSRLLGYLCN